MLLDRGYAGEVVWERVCCIPRSLLVLVLAFSLALPTAGLAYAVEEDEDLSRTDAEIAVVQDEAPDDLTEGVGSEPETEAGKEPAAELTSEPLTENKAIGDAAESSDEPEAVASDEPQEASEPSAQANTAAPADLGGNARNLVLLVRFAGDTTGDDATGFNASDTRYRSRWEHLTTSFNEANHTAYTGWGFRNYLYEVSGGKHDVVTDFPQTQSDGRVAYITLDQTANSFKKYDDLAFLRAVVDKFNAMSGSYDASRVDLDNDQVVDNVLVIPTGVSSSDDSPFWNHKAYASDPTLKIGLGDHARTVNVYNIIPSSTDSSLEWGLAAHEYLHTLGTKDYYRSDGNGSPVGVWDIMASSGSSSRPLAITRELLGWTKIDEKGAGEYTLSSTGLHDGQAILLKSPLNDTEYFVAEYRKKGKTVVELDSKIGGSGLIVYRVNPAFVNEGNIAGNDYVYVFRPGETGLGDSYVGGTPNNLTNAQIATHAYATGVSRTSVGVADLSADITQGALCYSDGQNSGIAIEATSQTDDSITFKVTYPDYRSADLWDAVVNVDGTGAMFGSDAVGIQTVVDGQNLYVALDRWGSYQVMKYDGANWAALGEAASGTYSGQLAIQGGELYFLSVRDESLELRMLDGTTWRDVASVSMGAGATASQVAMESIGEHIYVLAGANDATVKLYQLKETSLQAVSGVLPVQAIAHPTLFELNGNPAVACGDSFAEKSYVFEFVAGSWLERSVLEGGSSNTNSVASDGDETYVYQCLSKGLSNVPKLLVLDAYGKRSSVVDVPNLVSSYLEGSLAAANGILYLTLSDGQNAQATAKTFTASVSNLGDWEQLGENVYMPAGALSSSIVENEIYVGLVNETNQQATVRSHALINNVPAVPAEHKAIFKANGTVVGEVDFIEGAASLTEPAVPEKVGYAGSWPEYVLGKEDIVIEAVYTPHSYTVTFKNWDGKVLSSADHPFNSKVSAPNATRNPSDGKLYTFTGWSPAFTGVCDQPQAMEYIAQFSETSVAPKAHKAIFKAEDGTVVKEVVFSEGDKELAEIPSVPVKQGYTGTWSEYVLGTSDIIITPHYTANSYTVTFKNWDGKVLSSKSYSYGQRLTAPVNTYRPNSGGKTYAFTGWSPAFLGTCTGTAEYTAQYSSKAIEHTATFVADGKTVATLKFNEVDKKLVGNVPVVPTKSGYTGSWESYTLGTSDLTIKAKYVARSVGWFSTNKTWYYIDRPGHVKTGWLNLGGMWYYLDPAKSGAMRTGSYQVGSTVYHSRPSGAMISGNGWVLADGAWYFVSPSGAARTGWLNLGGTWYYLSPSTGAMATGWYRVGSTWYYSNASGAMRTGWLNLGGTWYYLSGSGSMAVGWARVGGTWYYLNDSGAMATGWKQLGSTWYYLSGSGAMQTGWIRLGATWYYLTGSGSMAANRWIGNYYLGSSGAMSTSAWVGPYYVGADGAWISARRR